MCVWFCCFPTAGQMLKPGVPASATCLWFVVTCSRRKPIKNYSDSLWAERLDVSKWSNNTNHQHTLPPSLHTFFLITHFLCIRIIRRIRLTKVEVFMSATLRKSADMKCSEPWELLQSQPHSCQRGHPEVIKDFIWEERNFKGSQWRHACSLVLILIRSLAAECWLTACFWWQIFIFLLFPTVVWSPAKTRRLFARQKISPPQQSHVLVSLTDYYTIIYSMVTNFSALSHTDKWLKRRFQI